MFQAIDPKQLLVSASIVAGLYCVIYSILRTWHAKIGLHQAQGLESLVFFLALDISVATGRVNLSCFVPDLIATPSYRQLFFAVIALFTLFGAIISSQLQAAGQRHSIVPPPSSTAGVLRRTYEALVSWVHHRLRPAVMRSLAWSVRAFFGTLHTILLIGIPV